MCSTSYGLSHCSKLDCSKMKTFIFFIITLSLVPGQYKYWPQSGLIILLAGSHQRYQPSRRGPVGLRAAREDLEDHGGCGYHYCCWHKGRKKGTGICTAPPLMQPISSTPVKQRLSYLSCIDGVCFFSRAFFSS